MPDQPHLRTFRSPILVAAAALFGIAHASAVAQHEFTQKLNVADTASFEYLARSLAVSGDVLVLGCWGDDVSGQDSGSAHVFNLRGDEWIEVAKLKASDARALTLFGITVAIDGDTIVVGSYQDDPRGTNSGSAYVFEHTESGWNEVAKLIPSDSVPGDQFGLTLAISDGVIIGGSQLVDVNGVNTGGAWVFEEVDGEWIERGRLVANDAAAEDQFAIDIAMDGARAIIGAARQDKGQTIDSGAAYIFEKQSDGSWRQKARLLAIDANEGDLFGVSVAIEGDRLLIGARRDDGATVDAGAAYVFERGEDARWVQKQKLVAPDADELDYFGGEVALRGDAALVGAWLDNDRGDWSGSASLYRRVDGEWRFAHKFTAPDGRRLDYFGVASAIADSTLIISAPEHDTLPFSDTGAAYVYTFRACRADVDGDGATNTQDVLEFLGQWSRRDASGDFNLDGAIDTQDVLTFLNGWAAGCEI